MTHTEYAEHVREFLIEMESVTKAKNADYSAGQDEALAGYYELSKAAEVSLIQAWMVLVMKHITAIQRYAKNGSVSSETIHGRFIDLANYAMMGDALTKNLAKAKAIHAS